MTVGLDAAAELRHCDVMERLIGEKRGFVADGAAGSALLGGHEEEGSTPPLPLIEAARIAREVSVPVVIHEDLRRLIGCQRILQILKGDQLFRRSARCLKSLTEPRQPSVSGQLARRPSQPIDEGTAYFLVRPAGTEVKALHLLQGDHRKSRLRRQDALARSGIGL